MSEEPVDEYCSEFGVCCRVSRYEVTFDGATFYVGEDLISLVSAFELFILLLLLIFSYARLDNSLILKKKRPTLYILPIYFAFVILLTLWYSITFLLILLPSIKDSFFTSVLYDGHAFFDNFLIVFSFFPNDGKSYTLYAFFISIFLMIISISLSYILYDPTCDYCSLFYPSNSQVYLWATLCVIYLALLSLISVKQLKKRVPYRPRKSLRIWLCYLIAIYFTLFIGSGLVSWPGIDVGFCVISGTEIVFVAIYGPLLFYTLVIDSKLLLRGELVSNDENETLLSLKNINGDSYQRESNPLFIGEDKEETEESDQVREAKRLTAHFPKLNFIELNQVRIGKKVGSGAMGEVYRATWNHTTIAIKRIFRGDKALADWMKEVKVLAKLSHPNILLFMGVSVDRDGDRCIITEFVDGGSVYDLIKGRTSEIPKSQIQQILKGTAVGMSYLHGFKIPILHRDLKSHNLLIDSVSGNIKVADFGLSRPIDNTMTATGTPQWSAPEVTRHERYSTKADVFSFGIVISELLNREQPYRGFTSFAAAYSVAYDGMRPEFSKETQNRYPEYVKLARMCWKEDPNERPSFPEIVEYLSNIHHGPEMQGQ